MNQMVRAASFLDGVEEPSPSLRVPFASVGAFACKYIIGEADENAVCCGARTDGRSWCVYHRRIVFDVSKPPRLR